MAVHVAPAGRRHLFDSQSEPAVAQSSASSQVAPVADLAAHIEVIQARGDWHWSLAEQAEVAGKRHLFVSQAALASEQSPASSQGPPADDFAAHLELTQTSVGALKQLLLNWQVPPVVGLGEQAPLMQTLFPH